MKWLLALFCFTTITALSQTKEPLLERLKKTQDRLSGKFSDSIPKQELGFKANPTEPQVTIIFPLEERYGLGTIPNLMPKQQPKPPLMDANRESIVIALAQDNMPCIVPNMEFYKVMPNAGSKIVLEKPIDPGIYLHKPKS